MIQSRWRRLARSRALRCCLFLLPMMMPWNAVGLLYGRAVARFAAAVLPDSDGAAVLRFGPAGPDSTGSDAWHLQVVGEDLITGQLVATVLDLRRSGYLASVMFVALCLATPLRWPKRAGLLLTGLALLQLLPVLPLLSFFSGDLPVTVFTLGTGARWAAGMAYRSLVAPPGMAFAVPGLLWLLLLWLIDRKVLVAGASSASAA